MKREILFKALTLSNNSWVQGSLIIHDNSILIDRKIYPFRYDKKRHSFSNVEVHPETVCQYTGLKDRSESMIFDCDKVKAFFPEGWYGEDCTLEENTTLELVVEWSDGWFLIDPYDSDKHFWMGGPLDSLNVQLEVIGNTHDKTK